ncbi:unknown [Acholeplasma sp. CAG:878]|nr:unknown [Acholeplasma sp. CAG:878]
MQVRSVISVILSFLIFIFIGTFVFIKVAKNVINYENIENYIENIDVLDIRIKNLNNLFGLKIKTNDNTLGDYIKTLGIYNGLTEEEINLILNDEKFEKNLKQLILNWYKESMNTNNTYVYNPLTKLDINKDFIDDIGNIFKNQNNIITSIENINVIFIIGIILFLTVLTGFITKTIYYPLITLGIPSLIIGIVYTMLKYNKDLFANSIKTLLPLSDNLTNLVLESALKSNIGTILITIGLVLIIIFTIVKLHINKMLRKLEQTRRINIEDIDMDNIKYN